MIPASRPHRSVGAIRVATRVPTHRPTYALGAPR